MKQGKNSKKNKRKNKKKGGATTQFLKKIREKRTEKYQDYAVQNLFQIEALLKAHHPLGAEAFVEHIADFMQTSIEGKSSELKIPANFDPGLLSQIFASISRWLGNTKEALKNEHFIKNKLDIAETPD